MNLTTSYRELIQTSLHWSVSYSYPVIPTHFIRKSLDTQRCSIIENEFETHSLIGD